MMTPIPSSYNLTLVVLSVAIAVSASYTALDVATQVTIAKGRSQVIWLCCGSAAMGMGIWAMHFIGMLAFRLPFAVEYDFNWVVVSVLPAILAAGLALFLVSRDTLGWPKLTIGSVLMGGGIATMHYVGMSAMQMPAAVQYDWPLVSLSILIAIAVSWVGLFLIFQLRADSTHQFQKRLLASVVMGAAIPTMHYTGMAAAQFVPHGADESLLFGELRAHADDESLAIAVIVIMAIIFAIAWTSTFLNRLKDSELKFKTLAEKEELLNQQLRESEVQQRQKNEALQVALDTVQSMQTQLVQAEKMSSLGQLVAGVAHEINNPVNFIHGNLNHVDSYAQDLLGLLALYRQHYATPVDSIQTRIDEIDLDFLQTDFVKMLSSMKLGTQRIREIVLSLRNFSRMDEGGLKTVDIHEGIDSSLMILGHRLKQTPNSPAVEVMRDYDVLPNVDCYPGPLNQVFMNILVNALDALETVGNQSVMTIRTSLVGDDWVEIAIADNGPGISDAAKARIFDPFFTTKAVGKGTGMGLSISYKVIVDQHGGKLDCVSSSAQGTEFVIRIPIRQTANRDN